jgi:hypothetical protein
MFVVEVMGLDLHPAILLIIYLAPISENILCSAFGGGKEREGSEEFLMKRHNLGPQGALFFMSVSDER